MTKVATLKELQETKYGQVLCYPKCEQNILENRLNELEKLGVCSIEFSGKTTVFDIPVLGKGYVGIVVIAHTKSEKVALKINRIDSGRETMFHEAQMLKKANSVNVGPELLKVSENFLLMQHIEGTNFPEWIKSVKDNKTGSRVSSVLKQVLEQCYRLDQAGLDHGEISSAQKHIIVDSNDVPFLIDFETSSIKRRVSNVTSVCQYFFLGSKIAPKVVDKLGNINEEELIKRLRSYKQNQTRENFEKILEIVQ
ncbi:MAG: serine/threonine protein kinase [Candidatus Bathyarchaeota archaeon]|nr:serine/threonine protein kinase [Candidatus Bathyarchaeota archaeon]